MRWCYLGNLGPNEALDWGGPSGGNIPASGYILPDIEDTRLYLKICEHARRGDFEGRQVDWDAHALKVNGPQLAAILLEVFGNEEGISPDGVIGQHFAYAEKLGDFRYVALMAVAM